MKKLLIVLFFIAVSSAMFGQSIFKPVPQNLFSSTSADRTAGTDAWLWRFSAVITATELTYDKESKQFLSAPLSSVGPAVGYKHFIPLADGTPYCQWGVSGALLLGTDINNIDKASMKAAVLVNAFQFFNIGGVYTFNQSNHFGILLGASINF